MDTGTGLALVPTVASTALYLAVMVLHLVVLRRRRRAGEPCGGRVSILKPLAGSDDELATNLASFARLDHHDYEILLGVASVDDAAYPIGREFVARHPEVRARVIVTDASAALNPKVAQLIGLERVSTGEVLIISDSNVRVAPGYLRSLLRELDGAGLVTSLFAGTGERSLGAALENLQLAAMTAPAVVAASVLPLLRPLTVGKSMAMRRKDLDTLGGFRAVGNVLAEDHVLGQRFLDAGHAVATCLDPIENRNVDCSIARTIERHTRWAKMRRAVAPRAFLLELLLCPLLVANAAVIAAPSRVTLIACALAALVQTATAFGAVRLLRGHSMKWRFAALEVLRSYVVLLCWVRALVSRHIDWRGHPFVILPGSVIVPAERRLGRWRPARA